MSYDLLVDPFNTVFAIDCEIRNNTLHCGALYVSPQVPFDFIRLAGSGASIDVVLPAQLRDQAQTLTLVEAQLPLHDAAQLQHPVPAD